MKVLDVYCGTLTTAKIDGTLQVVRKVDDRSALISTETDRREVCVRCGWVGRMAFQRDRHDLCEPIVEEEARENVEEAPVNGAVEDAAVALDEEELKRLQGLPRRRRRGIWPKKTVAVRRITRLDLATGQIELRELGADEPYERPRTRADCSNVPRPCPFVGCKHNLYLDTTEIGSLVFNFPHLEPEQMPADRSCSLDLSERGGMTLDQVGAAMALTRERARQVEVKALVELLSRLKERGIDRSDVLDLVLRYVTSPGGELIDSGVDGEEPSDAATILAASSDKEGEGT